MGLMHLLERLKKFTHSHAMKEAGIYPYFRPVNKSDGVHVEVNGEKKLLACSNDYVSLSTDPRVIEASDQALKKYGTSCSGSRFLNGNTIIHDELEETLANFLGYESCVVFSTGFFANLGSLTALSTKKTVIFSDKENHASIVDGNNLSLAKVCRYHHNDIERLESLLKKHEDTQEKIIVSDGVFSMTGEYARLPELVELSKKYNAFLYIDDAHGIGAAGKEGKGTEQHFNMSGSVDLNMGTFSKSLASIGGYVASNKDVINYIRHHARALIFSASIPPASAAAALKSLQIIRDEPERISRLHKNTEYARQLFNEYGFNVPEHGGPIIPIILEGENDMTFTFKFNQALFDHGIFCAPVLPPAVPMGTTLIRTSYMHNHTFEQIEFIVECFRKAAKDLGVF